MTFNGQDTPVFFSLPQGGTPFGAWGLLVTIFPFVAILFLRSCSNVSQSSSQFAGEFSASQHNLHLAGFGVWSSWQGRGMIHTVIVIAPPAVHPHAAPIGIEYPQLGVAQLFAANTA